MNLILPNYPIGKVIFCDDIRSEIGNKISLIGIYTNSIIIPAEVQFPVTLAKLGIAIFWYEPVDDYSDEITFRASLAPLDAKPDHEGPVLVETTQNLRD